MVLDTFDRFSAMLYNGDNVLLVFMHANPILQRGQLWSSYANVQSHSRNYSNFLDI